MDRNLYRTIYISTASHAFRDKDLQELLEVSRRNNLACGVTGVLAYHDYTFIQVLEGQRTSVEALLARIAADPRHYGIIFCDQASIAERTFGTWAMGWVPSVDLIQAGFDPAVLSIRNSPSAVVNALFHAFRQTVRLQ